MKVRPRLLIIALIIITVVFSISLLVDQSHTTVASNQPLVGVSLGVDKSQKIVIRIYYDNQEQLNEVSGELDIWEVHQSPGIGPGSDYAVAAVYPAQQNWLQVKGYRLELDPDKTALLQSPAAVLDQRYYYFDNYVNNPNKLYMVDFLQSINTTYPNITQLLDVGDAWLASHGGHHRDIWVLRITNEDPRYGDIAAKPTFFMFANIHAREVTTPEMAIRYIKYLTLGYLGEGGYGIDPDVTWLVDHHVAYIMLTINPDGRVINELDTDAWWRKNVDNNDGCTDPYNWGVDLNRNSSFLWGCCGGSSGAPCSETYRGPFASSEPETAAFQAFTASIFQDWNGNNGDNQIVPSPDHASGIFITLHAYADDILWPWGFAPGTAPNNAQLATIGRKLADITGVMAPTGGIGYLVDGASDDWVYGKLGVAAFTYEIGPDYGSCWGFFPPYGCQDGIDGMPRNFWAEMKDSFIYASKIAATPYITAYGPDSQALLVTPNKVPRGLPVILTGTVLDQRYSGDTLQPVTAAEYFIDTPGADGTGFAMSPADGTWGNTSEAVEAQVDTFGVDQGLHYLLVHAKNDEGVWGPLTAVFFEISAPTVPKAEFSSNSPVATGRLVEFVNETIGAAPLTYEWTFGDGFTTTVTNPTHFYNDLGTYTVTLSATNQYSTDSIEHSVTVEVVNLTGVELAQVSSGPVFPGDLIEFSANLLPNNASIPYDYTIDFGDGAVLDSTSSLDPLLLDHTYSVSNTYPVQISVMNYGMTTSVTATLEVKVFFKVLLPFTLK